MSVLILMSTYNGEQYLRTQLESILKQDCPEVDLLIRDDGSTDRTHAILEEYSRQYPQIRWYAGSNKGVRESFFELILKAEITYDYYAFADQDDEWLPGKISRAVTILESCEPEKPILYCSDKIIVDKELKPIEVTVSRIMKKAAFGNALVQDMCTGCTAVMNRRLLEIIRYQTPKYVIMHDWWFYLVATCFGTVYYDPESYIKYRQHGNNTSGAMLSKKDLLKYRLRQLKQPRGEIYRQTEEFLRIYGGGTSGIEQENGVRISPANLKLAETLLKSRTSFRERIKLALNKDIFRQKKSDDIVFRIVFIIGKL